MNFITGPHYQQSLSALESFVRNRALIGFSFPFPPDICREKWLPPKYPLAPSTDANEQTESELVRKWMWVTCPLSLLGLLRHHWHLFLPGLSKVTVGNCPLLGDSWSEGAPLKGRADLFSWNHPCIYLLLLRFDHPGWNALKCIRLN